jgi:hypothetical protein
MSWSSGTGKISRAEASDAVKKLTASQGGMDELQPLVEVQLAAAKNAALDLLQAITGRHAPEMAGNVTVNLSGHVNNNDASIPESISVYISVQE